MTQKTKLLILSLIFLLVAFFLANYLIYQTGKKSKATGETVNLSFNPQSISAPQGQTFTTSIKAQPSVDIVIRGYEFTVNFDKTKLQLTDINYRLGSVTIGLGDDNTKLSSVNANGILKIQGEIIATTGQTLTSTSSTEVVILTFNSTSSSSSTNPLTSAKFYKINTDYTISEIPGSNTNLNVNSSTGPTNTPTPTTTPGGPTATPTLTVTPGGPTNTPTPTTPPGATDTPTPTIWPTGGPSTVNLNIKLKFQGVLSKPDSQYATQKVKVTLVGGSLSGPVSKTADFTVNEQAVWKATVNFDNVSPGSGYIVLIKGPKHLQKKICNNNPTESWPGTYPGATGCMKRSVTLTEGENDLNFSGIYQLVGDLPTQDGIVNSYDISLVINSLGKNDAGSLKLADLNLDGVVNAQDYSLIISALSIRADEQ